MCGWLTDKFGVSWQVTPTILPKLLADPSKAEKVVNVFMKMRKFNIDELMHAQLFETNFCNYTAGKMKTNSKIVRELLANTTIAV